MISYIFKKFFYSFFVLWGVITLVFFLFNILPGDPARMMLDKREDAEQLLIINQKYGFDRSVTEQYILYLNDLSPISFIMLVRINSLNNNKYSFYSLMNFMDYNIVLTLYLRESFVRTVLKFLQLYLRHLKIH